MKLAPNLYRAGNDIVATYLVDTADGITIIDAGLPGHWRDLQKVLATLQKTPSDIQGVILTHGDSDHIGFAERLRRDHDVPVFVHAADAHRTRTGEKPKVSTGPMRLVPTIGFFMYALRKNGLRTKYVREVTEIHDGDVLDLPGEPRIIGMPGHSPGSVAVHVPAVNALFVGDALTNRHVLTGASGMQPAPFTDDPQRARESLDQLEEIEESWVLPGHGTPWHGSPADAVAAIRGVR